MWITSQNDAMSKLLEIRKTILDTMIERKKEIYDENDPVQINHLADVFDVRFWNLECSRAHGDLNCEEIWRRYESL